jgi:CRP/FNR family transcriptional regulator, cyclic AMP receptor protein
LPGPARAANIDRGARTWHEASARAPATRTSRPWDGEMPAAITNTHVRLLDADPALGAGLPDAARELARDLVVAPVAVLDRGPWRPALPGRPDEHTGFLVLEGVLFRRIAFAERESAELLGPGDLLRPWQRLRSSEFAAPATWTVVEAGTLAVLDGRATAMIARWPEVVAAVVGRAVERSRALAITLGIAQLPGVDLRVLAMLWHLAERFGRADGDRWVVPIRLTHQMLAALVRTQRPTVSAALGRLTEQGLIARAEDGTWTLIGGPPERLATLRDAIAA